MTFQWFKAKHAPKVNTTKALNKKEKEKIKMKYYRVLDNSNHVYLCKAVSLKRAEKVFEKHSEKNLNLHLIETFKNGSPIYTK